MMRISRLPWLSSVGGSDCSAELPLLNPVVQCDVDMGNGITRVMLKRGFARGSSWKSLNILHLSMSERDKHGFRQRHTLHGNLLVDQKLILNQTIKSSNHCGYASIWICRDCPEKAHESPPSILTLSLRTSSRA